MAIDHLEQAKHRVLLQYKEKPAFEKLLRIFVERIQVLDDILLAIMRERSIQYARGSNLDMIGRTLDFRRINNWDDETYRFYLRVINRVRRSYGTFKDIYEVAVLLRTESMAPIEVIFPFPKAAVVEIPDVLPSQEQIVAQFLLDTVTATTGINVISYDSDEYFGFLEDPNAKGFNEGKLAKILNP